MTAAVYVGGPFHRVRDKRLVRQVVSAQHQPHHWLPMDITTTGTIHLRRRQIFKIFDPYPLPSAFQQNAYEGDF